MRRVMVLEWINPQSKMSADSIITIMHDDYDVYKTLAKSMDVLRQAVSELLISLADCIMSGTFTITPQRWNVFTF